MEAMDEKFTVKKEEIADKIADRCFMDKWDGLLEAVTNRLPSLLTYEYFCSGCSRRVSMATEYSCCLLVTYCDTKCQNRHGEAHKAAMLEVRQADEPLVSKCVSKLS
eukprot:gb/GEZN01010750.1/.p3 GENE.gb/GEZN01010750.1/~~gb/GEZN01010750.1/.p3  ORF type:complete len:107 (-),score=6.49 gb/GEZN01010750.1/:254-574(-)